MSHDFCLSCGVILPSRIYECPVCGFDNSFEAYQDISLDEEFFIDSLGDEFNPEESPGL